MITVNSISIHFSGNYLFDNVSFVVGDRDRIGLVGKNGAGKSTLLKIIAGQQECEKGNIVVSSIVSLGQLLNMKIVAEGVETQEQFEFLRDIFCDEIQGYYFSKPIPKVEYEKLLTKGAL